MHPHHIGSNTSTNDEISSSQPHHPHRYDSNSPFLQDHDGVVLSYLLSQQQFLMMDSNSSQSAEISVAASNQGLIEEEEKIQSSKKKKKAAAPRKRSSGKKDRHSKICTAQGPRDRRMRLSVPIARKFFDLQDMLGFDKASRTIDWLFTKSKSAIKELKQHMILPSCSTSTIDAVNYINSLSTSTESNEVVSRTMQTHCVPKGESSMGMNKDPQQNMRRLCRVGKGSRDEARARARERTREKMRIRSGCKTNQDIDEENPKDIGLCLGKEVLTNHELLEQAGANSMMRNNAEEHKTLMGIRSTSASRSGPTLEDDGGEFPCFTGNWGTKMQSFQRKTDVIKTFSGNRVLQVENPSAPIMGMTMIPVKQQEPSNTTTSLQSFTGSNSQEQQYSGSSVFMTPIPKPNTLEVLNPSSIKFMPNQDEDHNRNSFFITTLISQDQTPGQFLRFN